MRVAFRTDASTQIGSGHVMRCLTLADELSGRGAQTQFIVRALPGQLADLIIQRGHRCTLLPAPTPPAAPSGPPAHAAWLGVPWQQDAEESEQVLSTAGELDWLVVDHYALDARWEGLLRRARRRILVIDDLADRPHDCDLLVECNLQESADRYARLVPPTCQTLLGPGYALLRPQFIAERQTRPRRDGTVGRILVFFGGSDADNLTARTMAALLQLGRPDLQVDVVIGANNPRRHLLAQQWASLPQVTCHFNLPDLAELMTRADLAIGAAGVTTWERACVGLPAIIVTIAENQRPTAAMAQRSGILQWLGDAAEVSTEQLTTAVRAALQTPPTLAEQSRRAMELVDGSGTGRIAQAMQALQA